MQSWYFSEGAYPYLPNEEEYDSIRVKLPNRYYDPKIGADLYHRYIDEWCIAEDLGLDLMINEHHQTATNVTPSAAVLLGALAYATKKARILILGNPIANRRQPVRVAEEMAMIDNYSRGRLEVGFVRGVPYEVSAGNSNPVRMVERFWEAHDLILKAFTTHDGPFNWEGKFFHHRQVNIWPRPYQDPHPPIWITANSLSQVERVAQRNYVCATFLTGYDQTKAIFDKYRETQAKEGKKAKNDRLAYAALIYTGQTDEEGYAGAEKVLWYLRANKVPPQFTNPPGYSSIEANVAAMKRAASGIYGAFGKQATVEAAIEQGILFAGNPDTVYQQIKKHYDHVGGYGHLLLMGQSGFLEHEETVKGLTNFAKEIYPRLKEL